jgi:hypothetical protein
MTIADQGEATVPVSDKYEREIEEILRKASFKGPKRRPGANWTAGFASAAQHHLIGWSPTRLLALGMVLALVGYFVRDFVPGVGAPLSLLALLLLLAGLVLSMSQRNGRRAPGWRGRSWESSPSGPDLWAGLKQRWDLWRRGRR